MEKAEGELKSRVMAMDKMERRVSGLQGEVEQCNVDIHRLNDKLVQAEVAKTELHSRLEVGRCRSTQCLSVKRTACTMS
jgi:wobble nucleotide-excising tRNase